MERKVRICILRVGGTNRDGDAATCFRELGAEAEVIHLNDILRRRSLATYDGLVLPGGFAYGDYVRAGAILGKKLLSGMRNDIQQFVAAEKPVLGICNGFQVLIEAGVLPGNNIADDVPSAALGPNRSGRFECRWIRLDPNRASNCIFTKAIKPSAQFPIAHGEGRFIAGPRIVEMLAKKNLTAIRYVREDGKPARGKYPDNPNGSLDDIAGICNEAGTVFGLMPHPENAFRAEQMPYWSGASVGAEHGDGYAIFHSMVEYIKKHF